MVILPASIYLLKVNNRNTRTRCETCSNVTIKTPEQRHWRCSGVFIVNFEHTSYIFLVLLLLTLNKELTTGLEIPSTLKTKLFSYTKIVL